MEDLKIKVLTGMTLDRASDFSAKEAFGILVLFREAISAKIAEAELALIRHEKYERQDKVNRFTEYLSFYRKCYEIVDALISLHKLGTLRSADDVKALCRMFGKESDKPSQGFNPGQVLT